MFNITIILTALIIFLLSILVIVAMWKVLVKAGEKGWKAIIPFYNMFVLFKIAGLPKYLFWVYVGILLLGTFLGNTASFIVNIFALAIGIHYCIEVSKRFGKSNRFALLLMLLPFIGWPILGFGKAKYIPIKKKKSNKKHKSEDIK